MDTAFATSLGTPSTGWSSFVRPGQAFRHSEPHPASWAGLPHPSPVGYISGLGQDRRVTTSSATWTSSSGDLADVSDADDVDDRREFVQEYNRMARKYGVRPMIPENQTSSLASRSPPPQRRRWFSRNFLRQVSTASDASSMNSTKRITLKRSVGDIALNFVNGARKDNLKDEDLQSLVRLCGKSVLCLPPEYAPGSLVLPTCFRATAQHLLQHGTDTRGVFRVPGAVRAVNALYDYYCADGDMGEVIDSTIRCPNLPTHIKAGTHDVASTFKRLLSGLPGGILGSLSLFDAFVAIHSHLKGEPEYPRTKQTKVRARLIALAIGTVESQLRRDLICAVFGLLCHIGRTAEQAPREDKHGRPLPTADLMGYSALGIVFGPLLVGELIDCYSMRIADPHAGLVLFPVPPRTACRKDRRKCKVGEDVHPPALAIDKVHEANSITEMLITHWREVVRQMKDLEIPKPGGRRDWSGSRAPPSQPNPVIRPSISESFIKRKPAGWCPTQPTPGPFGIGVSSAPSTPSKTRLERDENAPSSLVIPRRRPKDMRPLSNTRVRVESSIPLLSPPAEEPSPAEFEGSKGINLMEHLYRYSAEEPSQTESKTSKGIDLMEHLDRYPTALQHPPTVQDPRSPRPAPPSASGRAPVTSPVAAPSSHGLAVASSFDSPGELNVQREPSTRTPLRRRPAASKRGSDDTAMPRAHGRRVRPNTQKKSTVSPVAAASEPAASTTQEVESEEGIASIFSMRSSKPRHPRVKRSSDAQGTREQTERPEAAVERKKSRGPPKSANYRSVRLTTPIDVEEKALRDDRLKTDVFARGRSRLSAWRSRRRSSFSTDNGSPVPRAPTRGAAQMDSVGQGSAQELSLHRYTPGSRSAPINKSQESHDEVAGDAAGERTGTADTLGENHSRVNANLVNQEGPNRSDVVTSVQMSDHDGERCCIQEAPGRSATAEGASCERTGTSRGQENQTGEALQSAAVEMSPCDLTNRPAQSVSRLSPVKSAGTAVKAIAAKFERASKSPPPVPNRKQRAKSQVEFKPNSMVSQYMVNSLPARSPDDSPKAPRPRVLLSTSHFQHAGESRAEASEDVDRESRASVPGVARSDGVQSPLGGDTPTDPETQASTEPALDREAPPPAVKKSPAQQAPDPEPVSPPPNNLSIINATPTTERHATPATPEPSTPTPQQQGRAAPETPTRHSSTRSKQAAELARLREQLSRAEQACARWRERAERAEQRVLALEADGAADGWLGLLGEERDEDLDGRALEQQRYVQFRAGRFHDEDSRDTAAREDDCVDVAALLGGGSGGRGVVSSGLNG